MAEVDLFVKSVVLCLFLPFCFIIVIYILTDGNLEDYKWLTSYEEIRKRVSTMFWSNSMKDYTTALKELDKGNFCSMSFHKSYDARLCKQGLVRILEIQAENDSQTLTLRERNAFYEPLFYKSKVSPGVMTEKFIGDLNGIADNQIDVVVSTLILSSVPNAEKTLEEIQRVLSPEGKFYYWEFVRSVPDSWLSFAQSMLSKVWMIVFHNDWGHSDIDHVIESSTGFSIVEHKRFDVPFHKGPWRVVKVHVMGVAIK